MKKIALPAAVAGALLMGANSLVAAMDGVIVRFVPGRSTRSASSSSVTLPA